MTVLLLALGTAVAATPAPAPASPPTAASTAPTATPAATPLGAAGTVDCTVLTGDAKSHCDAQVALNADLLYLGSLGDCTKLLADAKTDCDAKTKDLNAKIAALQLLLAPVAPAKGAKAVRSDTNHLEAEDSDE